jgi:uncharacterized phage-associated protein
MDFTVDKAKAVEALVYVAAKLGEVSRFNAAKILYFADRQHLRTYGRPVTGDYYVAMDNGPVPSFVYDVLKQAVRPADRALVAGALAAVEGSHFPKVRALREPNMEVFSVSDVECLDYGIEHVGNRSFGSVSDETHKHVAWKNASDNGKMAFADMLDGVAPEVIEDAELSAVYAVL